MASREKRALAPSKSRQKANNDSISNSLATTTTESSSSSSSNRIAKKSAAGATGQLRSIGSTRSSTQQLAREIVEAVATGSQLPAKIEAGLPRKRAVLQTALKRKQKARKTLIKAKQKQQATKASSAQLKRIAAVDAKIVGLKGRRRANPLADHRLTDETKYKCKTAKKPKALVKEELEREEQKISPKLGRRLVQISARGRRAVKGTRKTKKSLAEVVKKEPEIVQIKQEIKEEIEDEEEEDLEGQSLNQEKVKIKTEPVEHSVELTIEEVITTSMHIEPNALQVKIEQPSEAELFQGRQSLNNFAAKRSLRNGKLRQILPKIQTDADQKRGVDMSEASVESGLEPKSLCLDGETVTVKVEATTSEDEAMSNHHGSESLELETNNNGCDEVAVVVATAVADVGPTLRSKTKARNSDSGSESVTSDDAKSSNKPIETDAVKKERGLAKLGEMKSVTPAPAVAGNSPKSRRSSLNIDLRRNSLCADKPPVSSAGSKVIDDMIDQIKLSIAKTIESRLIFRPDGRSPALLAKNFDVKVEEVVAPLSNDSSVSKPRIDDDVAEESSNTSKNRDLSMGIGSGLEKKEMAEEKTNNSVPKVADTAKEIEKLVMGDIESPADSKPSEETDKQEQPADEVVIEIINESDAPNEKAGTENASTEAHDNSEKNSSFKQPESAKKSTVTNCVKRKSPRSAMAKSVTENTTETSVECRKQNDETQLNSLDKSKELKQSVSTPEDTLETTVECKKQNLPKELDSSDTSKELKQSISTPEDTSETTMEWIQNDEPNEDDNESKTVPVKKPSVEAAKTAETSTESNAKMEIDESIEPDKCEETLESLTRDVERLVEAERESIDEHDTSSSTEIWPLVIDSESLEPLLPPTSHNKEGCDQKSSTEDSNDVQTIHEAATVKEISGDAQSSESENITATPETNATNTTNVAATKSGTESKTKEATKAAKSTEVQKIEEQKETRRSLRTRGDKHKKYETTKSVPTVVAHDKSDTKTVKSEDAATSEVPSNITENSAETDDKGNQSQAAAETVLNDVVIKEEPIEQPEPQIRTRRSREVKRPAPVPVPAKGKRGPKKQEAKKADCPIKEETLLDNEVAKINENNRTACLQANDSVRVVSANASSSNISQPKHDAAKSRSKSENDVASSVVTTDDDVVAVDEKTGTVYEGSTDGESTSSSEPILETPEDRAKKEAILRQLGLESWERVKEREAKKGEEAKVDSKKEDDPKKEQQSSGSLKTVIRLQKEKEIKKRSRSPIKMVLKQQGRVDGEESIDFYTIQKEIGSSGVGESSSGANRKLPTNPRYSCDNNEESEEAPIKDRQSLVIPEKSSSFSIHPERLCSDNCCYCHGKFGSLDTPMHLAQMKSDQRRNKILAIETHLNRDSCLCDACYRHVDRKANASPSSLHLKPPRQNRQFHAMKCAVIECFDLARHHVKRRWLIKIKPQIRNEVELNWESAQQNLVPFCETHYSKVARFLTCTLCKRRLTRNSTFPLGLTDSIITDLNARLQHRGIPSCIVAHTFTCRLCKFFMKLTLKCNDNLENLSDNNRTFYRNYKKKLLYFYDIEYESEEEEEVESNQICKSKDKNRPVAISINSSNISKKCKPGPKPRASKSPDNFEIQSTSTSDKSTPEPPHHDITEPEVTIKEEGMATSSNSTTFSDSRFMGIEGAIEKLKKRKALDTTLTQGESNGNVRGVVEILSMDKEVTLTRLPKKPRLANSGPGTPGTANDITPVVQRLGANPSISVRTLFPGEEEMNLHASVEFNNIREVTPQGWEKCATIIQYDRDTKLLWQELQRPYGNQSSFLRHLILLEKYYRAGDLILAPNASRNAINYSTSVQNRLISYEGPEKNDEPATMEPVNAVEYNNSRRLSGGFVLENRVSQPSTSSSTSSNFVNVTAQLSRMEPSSRPMKLTPGVSIIKKPPPNLQRLNTNHTGSVSGGAGGLNGSAKRKESIPIQKVQSGNSATIGGKVIQLTEPDFKRFQNLKRQKQMMNEKQGTSNPNSGSGSSGSTLTNYGKNNSYLQKAQQMLTQQQQFQKHLRMSQEMLAQRSRGEIEPSLLCDVRLANENTPTQNLIHTLNLPKSIQVTTKAANVMMPMAASTPVPILPKIPRSLTVIAQPVARLQDK